MEISKELKSKELKELHQNFHSKSEKIRPSTCYLDNIQKYLEKQMRSIVVHFLIEVAMDLGIGQDTIYLAVNRLDRFLSDRSIRSKKFTTVGASCLLLAAKYHSSEYPSVVQLLQAVNSKSTIVLRAEEIWTTELDVLQAIDCRVGNPTVNTFLRYFTPIAEEDCTDLDKFQCLIQFLVELILLEYECLQFIPAMQAASIILVSRYTLQPEEHPWNSDLCDRIGYTAADLKQCVQIIHQLQSDQCGSQFVNRATCKLVKKKYQEQQFCRVSTLDLPQYMDSLFENN